MSRAAGGALAKVECAEAVPRRGGTRFELGCAMALLARTGTTRARVTRASR